MRHTTLHQGGAKYNLTPSTVTPLFSRPLLKTSSQDLFSRPLLKTSSQDLFSRPLLKTFSQDLFSRPLLKTSSQDLFSPVGCFSIVKKSSKLLSISFGKKMKFPINSET